MVGSGGRWRDNGEAWETMGGVERRRSAEKRKEAIGNDGGQKMEDGGKGTVGDP